MKNNDKSLNRFFENAALAIAIFFIALIPLFVRNYLAKYPMSDFVWFHNQTVFVDTYSVFRANVIMILGMVSLVLLIWKQIKFKSLSIKDPVVIATLVFSAVTLLSHLTSINTYFSSNGYLDRREGVWVWLAYLAVFLFLYASRWSEKSLSVLLRFFIGSNVILCTIGIMQYFGFHILLADWMQPFLNSIEMAGVAYDSSYSIDYTVILQLFSHYNYVGYYIALSFPIVLSLMLYETDKIKKILYGLLVVMLLFNLLGSTARGGLVAIIISMPVFIVINRKKLIKNIKLTGVVLALFVIIFVGFEIYSGGFVTMRIKSTFTSVATPNILQEAKVEDDTISFKISDQWYDVIVESFENNEWKVSYQLDDKVIVPIGTDEKGAMYFDESVLPNVRNFLSKSDDKLYFTVEILGEPWYFYYNEDKLTYLNVYGKYDAIIKPKAFGFEGREKLGSARGYIWSRSLPLIFDRPLLGYGPDTFTLAFPQNDYVGKYNAYDTTNTLVDKAHNLFIQIAMNSGLIALFSYLSLFVILTARVIKSTANTQITVSNAIQSGTLTALFAYFIASFFNDSTVQVSPVFWGILALAFVSFKETTNMVKSK